MTILEKVLDSLKYIPVTSIPNYELSEEGKTNSIKSLAKSFGHVVYAAGALALLAGSIEYGTPKFWKWDLWKGNQVQEGESGVERSENGILNNNQSDNYYIREPPQSRV